MVTNKDAQSFRAKSGNEFEKIIIKILNSFLEKDRIVVTRARENNLETLIGNQENLRNIMDYTKIPVKRRCDQTQLQDYPDLDLFALLKPQNNEPWKLIAIISCKVSFHARHTESAFWGLLVRLTSNIPFVIVTEDRDIDSGKSSELGRSCNESTVTRRLLESFASGIYLIKQYKTQSDKILIKDIERKRNLLKQNNTSNIVFDNPDVRNHTRYCFSVRPFDDLINDLRKWRDEIV